MIAKATCRSGSSARCRTTVQNETSYEAAAVAGRDEEAARDARYARYMATPDAQVGFRRHRRSIELEDVEPRVAIAR